MRLLASSSTILFLLVPLAALALASARQPNDAAQALHRQLEEDWRYWMAAHPELATQVGFPGHDDRWTDYSPAAIEARAAYLRASLQRLAGLDREALGEDDRLTYDLYRQLLESAVQGLELHYEAVPIRGVVPRHRYMPINQLEGIQQDIARILALAPAARLSDYENLVARLERVPPLVDQTIALMEEGLERGLTPPRIALRDVPEQVADQIVDDPLKSRMLEAFTRWPAGIAEADRRRLTERAVTAYRERVLPAFRRLHRFLTETYLPACRESTSAAALPGGEALYAYNVRWHTTTDLAPARIHEIGLAEVKRIREAMDRAIRDSGFRGGFEAFLEFLRTDPRFYYTAADELLRGYRDIAKRADPELARLFGRLPQTPYGVRPVPEEIAPSQTTAYYEPGSLRAGRAGYMYANTYKLEARPKWEMEALTLHEAVPGHHLQIALAQEREGLPEFRRHSSYTAFVEGWALYAERLGEEMGFYTDPYSKFGQLTYEMWRAVRLVVDTGLHAMGWSRRQAIDYFRANAPKTEQDILVEIDRYIVWPGQALGYKIGELKIRELRAKAERALGPRFDVRAFHDLVLAEGAVPLDVLEARVDAWIRRN
ncbi:MAG TPA: DUF885 domain-containing protein [Vicinamibacterales bacterium]|nr:DUF885 domain-containing protein [Vicinamibacterales bacterium]